MTIRLSLVASIVVAAGLLAPAPVARAADESGGAYKALTDKVGPALVTVKFVLKVEGGEGGRSGEGGRDVETAGVVIESTGLVLVSNAKMGGLASRMGVNANPTDIKILAGDDTEGLKARIIARDSDIDLCWLQIDDEKAKGTSFSAIDISASTTPTIGDKLFLVDRMGKFFDHALVVDEGRLGGMTRKPRHLLIPTDIGGSGGRGGDGALGMPMFTADGKLVGVNVVQLPSKEDAEGGDSMGSGNFAILLLPADEVLKATNRTKEIVAKGGGESSSADTDGKPGAKAEEKK